jgi:tRNA dimethylallyltransferase
MVRNSQPKILVVVGPTASGKSDLAVRLAKTYGGEVISADSRQVYTGLDIGTGKITTREMQGVPHHLLDVCSPKKVFSAYDFVTHARRILQLTVVKNKVPIIAGGTGFYIDALLGRVALGDAAADTALRKKLELKTTPQLLALLKRKNPTRYADIVRKNEQNNRVRLIRAIELASSPTQMSKETPWTYAHVLWIGIAPSDTELKQKIKKRLVARLRRGMVAEAKRLHAQGVSYKRMDQLGLEYRYLALLLQGNITKDEFIEQLSAKIWQYARRQKTYWKRNKDIVWFAPTEYKKIERTVKDFLRS